MYRGMGLPAIGGGMGAAIGQGLSTGMDIAGKAGDIEGQQLKLAITQETARRESEAYRRSMQPIAIDKIRDATPPHMRSGVYKALQAEGIIEDNEGEQFVRQGRLKEFHDSLGKSMVKRALIMDSAKGELSQMQKEIKQNRDALMQGDKNKNKIGVQEILDGFEGKLNDLEAQRWDEARQIMKPVKADAKAKILADRAKYIREDPDYIQAKKFEQNAMDLQRESDQLLTAIGLDENKHMKHKEEFDYETAMKIALGYSTPEAERKKKADELATARETAWEEARLRLSLGQQQGKERLKQMGPSQRPDKPPADVVKGQEARKNAQTAIAAQFGQEVLGHEKLPIMVDTYVNLTKAGKKPVDVLKKIAEIMKTGKGEQMPNPYLSK